MSGDCTLPNLSGKYDYAGGKTPPNSPSASRQKNRVGFVEIPKGCGHVRHIMEKAYWGIVVEEYALKALSRRQAEETKSFREQKPVWQISLDPEEPGPLLRVRGPL